MALKEYKNHITLCTINTPHPIGKYTIDFKTMSHKKVLNYFKQNPSEIEANMRIVDQETFIGHSRVDLIGIDINLKTCFIEVVHKSHYHEAHWEQKIRECAKSILSLIGLITHESPERWREGIRLIIFRPGKGIIKELVLKAY